MSMNYSSTPFLDPNAYPTDHSHQRRPPYSTSLSPCLRPVGFHAPSVGFTVGPLLCMPRPHAGVGLRSPSPRGAPYPPLPRSPGIDPNHSLSLYPRAPSSLSLIGNQACSTKAQNYLQPPSYSGDRRKTYPFGEHGHSNPQSSLYPKIPSPNAPHPTQRLGFVDVHSNPDSTIKISPTVVPVNPFFPQKDAEILRRAMTGLVFDKNSILNNILARRSNAQRWEITHQYKHLFGKLLVKELKSELSGNFEKIIVALTIPLSRFYAKELREALSGFGTDETVVIQILCTLTNAEILTIKEVYQKIYRKTFMADLRSDTSGHFKHLMVSLCMATRDESTITDPEAAAAEAQSLHNSKRWGGTEDSIFIALLCQRNHHQLRLIFEEYRNISGRDIETTIKSKFSGDTKEALLAVIRSIRNKPVFFAKELRKSLVGLETNHSRLIRLVVTRCEIDMGDIKREYAAKYKESLAGVIRAETVGDYRKCLLALLGEA